MKRIRILYAVISILLLQACTNKDEPNGSHNNKYPNIIFILVDDLGYGDLGCYGQKTLTTPNLDRMAAGGILFSNFYTGSTVCAPSRASLLTGKHTGHCSVRGNHPDQLAGDEEVTLASILKRAGYHTAAIGKWGVGHPPPADDPKKKGFDYFYGYLNMWHAHNYYPEFLYRDGLKVYLKNKLRLVDGKNPWADMPEGTGVAEIRKEYVHDLFDQEALKFIEHNKDQLFFLYLAYNAPHTNNEMKPDGMEVPDYGEYDKMNWPPAEKGFAAMIRNIDNSVGLVLAKLKELDIDKNTIVFFCSDNGPHNKEGGHQAEFFNSNGPLRGVKRDLYEGGIRTPFIVHWPKVIKAGLRTDHTGAFWDVLPTFCDIVGTDRPADTDGISFLPLLEGKSDQQQRQSYLYWEFYEQGGKQALLKEDWKAVKRNVRDELKPVSFELYDLGRDPAETNNVAAQNPEIVAEMEDLFKQARREFPVADLFKTK